MNENDYAIIQAKPELTLRVPRLCNYDASTEPRGPSALPLHGKPCSDQRAVGSGQMRRLHCHDASTEPRGPSALPLPIPTFREVSCGSWLNISGGLRLAPA